MSRRNAERQFWLDTETHWDWPVRPTYHVNIIYCLRHWKIHRALLKERFSGCVAIDQDRVIAEGTMGDETGHLVSPLCKTEMVI
jgi:hypothetical protein